MAGEEGRKIIANYRPGMENREHLKLSTKEAHDPQLKPLSSLAENTCRAAPTSVSGLLNDPHPCSG